MTSLDQHTTNGAYYNSRLRDYDDDAQVDEDEEYREDLFLRQHYSRQQHGHHGLTHADDQDDSDDSDDDTTMYGRAANHYLQQQQQQRLRSHHGSHHAYDSDDSNSDDDGGDHEDYNELDMDQHNIQLLSGSMSVRSPFLDAIREEEEEEPAFTSKPSSYPTFNSGRYLNRKSGEGFSAWTNRASSYSTVSKDIEPQPQQSAHMDDQQRQDYNSVSSQDDISKPRGPRPLGGRPRSNTSSLTKVTMGFDVAASPTSAPSTSIQGTPSQEHPEEEEIVIRPRAATRSNPASPESTIQDLEVKRVLEGAEARAAASATAAAAAAAAVVATVPVLNESSTSTSSKSVQSPDSTPLPSASIKDSSTTSISSRPGSVPVGEEVSFGQDTQKSIDDFFGMVKADLDKRIQEAIQEVEQKFLDRVQKLEQHTSSLAGGPLPGEALSISSTPAPGSLMESLTKPLPPGQNPGGSLALRKEILSHVTEKVGDLDLRVNQMEVLVSYKLVDIESKVKDLHGAHNSIAQKVHQVANSHQSNMQGIHAGKDVGYNTIDAEQRRVTAALQPYRGIDSEGRGAPAEYLKPIDEDEDEEEDDEQDRDKGTIVSRRNRSIENPSTSMALVDTSSSIVELRGELQALGVRYQELNEGLLSDLMGQMRDAKLMLFQTVDEVDSRISRRVDRIEAEMHSKLLSEIEGRVQERVRAMEQSSSRLERCFDKMEGRLAALETVLASKRPRPESMYQLLQQQLQHQQQQEEEEAEQQQQQQQPQSQSYHHDTLSSTQRPRRRTLAEQEELAKQGSAVSSDSALITLPIEGDGHSQLIENKAPEAGPFDGFVSIPQTKPIWTPTRGAGGGLDSTVSSYSSSYSGNAVASPLERGTVIGSRMGTIHTDYKPRTTYVPSTPTKEKSLPSSPQQPPQPQPPQQESSNRVRRISLSGFDANSLSALKPVKSPTSPSPASAGGSLSSSSLTTTMTTTMTTTTTTTAQLNNRQSNGSSSSSNGSYGKTAGKQGNSMTPRSMSATSLLTARLHSSSTGGSVSGSGMSGSTSANSTISHSSEVGAGVFTTMTHRSMSYDTIHSATSTTAKPSKPAQGSSSYRELLHFWKAGGSK